MLEAKDRLGGRIQTIRHGKLPVELGAEFVHGHDKTLAAAIQKAGRPTHAVPDKNQILQKGRLQPVQIWEQVSEIVKKINAGAPDESFL